MSQKLPAKPVILSLFLLAFENQPRLNEILQAIDRWGWAGEVDRDFSTQGTGRLYAAIVTDAQGAPTHLCRLIRRHTAGVLRRSVGLSEFESLTAEHATTLAQACLHHAAGGRGRRRDAAAL